MRPYENRQALLKDIAVRICFGSLGLGVMYGSLFVMFSVSRWLPTHQPEWLVLGFMTHILMGLLLLASVLLLGAVLFAGWSGNAPEETEESE